MTMLFDFHPSCGFSSEDRDELIGISCGLAMLTELLRGSAGYDLVVQIEAKVDKLLSGLSETGKIEELADRVQVLEQACSKQNDEVCQILGKALGHVWYCDDQKNFPGATEANGVCVGDHVAESLAMAAARKIGNLAVDRAEMLATLTRALVFARDGHTAKVNSIIVDCVDKLSRSDENVGS